MNNLNNADIDVLMLQNFEFNWFLHYGRFFSPTISLRKTNESVVLALF